MLRIDPTLPMLRIEPALPMLRIEPALPMLRIEPALPIETSESALNRLATLKRLYALWTLAMVGRIEGIVPTDLRS